MRFRAPCTRNPQPAPPHRLPAMAQRAPSQAPFPPPYSAHASSRRQDLRLSRRAARRHGRAGRAAARRRPPSAGLRRSAAALDAGASARLGRRRRLHAASPAPPREERGRRRLAPAIGARAQGRSAASHRRACHASERGRTRPGAARRDRFGQDLHHGQGHRGDAASGAGSRAEQDPRRPALRRVQDLLPRQRGRVFRLVLRLLPARGLYPAHRHLYREGLARSTSRSTACAMRRRAR